MLHEWKSNSLAQNWKLFRMRHEFFDFEDALFHKIWWKEKAGKNAPANQIFEIKEVRPTNSDHRFGISVKNCIGKPRLNWNLRMHFWDRIIVASFYRVKSAGQNLPFYSRALQIREFEKNSAEKTPPSLHSALTFPVQHKTAKSVRLARAVSNTFLCECRETTRYVPSKTFQSHLS